MRTVNVRQKPWRVSKDRAFVAASRPVLVKPTDQTESLAPARLSARKEPHTMEEMNEDTIEVLLFEDLDTIHRQDWAAL